MQHAPHPENERIGLILGQRFKIDSHLRTGGIGTLYLAQDLHQNQWAVIKTLRLHNLGSKTKALFRRFQREGKILSDCEHPCIVKVIAYDFFDDTLPYIALEHIDGITLREYLNRFPVGLPINRFLPLMKQFCSAVNRIHAQGIIHRDIKPNNMMVQLLDQKLRLKLLDFGLILIERTIGQGAETRLTQKGQLLGTPAYMSPEQCRGEATTQESDIYNLGLIAYELLTGHPAIEGLTMQRLIDNQIEKMPTPLVEKRGDVSTRMSEAIMKALSKQPSQRYHSAKNFWEALQA